MAESNDSENIIHFPRRGREDYDDIKALQEMAKNSSFPPPPRTIEESLRQGREIIVHGLSRAAENGVRLDPTDD